MKNFNLNKLALLAWSIAATPAVSEVPLWAPLDILGGDNKPAPMVQNQSASPLPEGVDVYKLQSKPDGKGVIYISVTGATFAAGTYWANDINRGQELTLAPANIPEDSLYDIWRTLKEDYAPFDLNITTDSAIFNAATPGERHELLLSSSSSKAGGSTGKARLKSYTMDTPTLCFTDQYKGSAYKIGEVCSHEVGHSFGLLHDGGPLYAGGNVVAYYFGHGESETHHKLWSALMGSGTSAQVSHWSKGEYPRANQKEDDLAIISGHHFGYRTDDHANDISGATELVVVENAISQFEIGVIETQNDVDLFSFTSPGGVAQIIASPAEYKPNLKIQIELLNESGEVIATHTRTDNRMDAVIAIRLDAGKYYVRIDGVGHLSLSDGYSDYGSLGYYSISGNL